ncbi:MAG: phenylalanine--tRNA ligase subunit beta [Patescibacteria group bacterium]|nr:phenylalanine--tRNA ligase subunit beta [Patescibacteria group bacterium]
MKFSYSLIKKFIPQVPAKKKFVAEFNLKAFETEDAGGDVLDISLPANRYSDAASHWGIAKEASAIFQKKIVLPKGLSLSVNMPEGNGLVGVRVENPADCPRYEAVVLQLDGKKHSSPVWLKKTLIACGLRPISLVVDIMNYVMLEVGQPLHAFDYDKVAGGRKKNIVVRLARSGEKAGTLDGKICDLTSADLVIADADGFLAIAGIKGGKKAEVDGSTKRIIVESANFDQARIYATSKKTGILTDASARFSRNLSPELAEYGANRAVVLLKELAGARVIDSTDYYPRPIGKEIIGFNLEKMSGILGADLPRKEVVSILKGLGMSVLTAGKSAEGRFDFLVEIPTIRRDVQSFEDLTEEVGRIYGYNNIKPEAPRISVKPAEVDDAFVTREKCRDFLLNLGFSEIYSYSFFGRPESEWLFGGAGERKLIELQNPIAEDKRYLRGELISGIIQALDGNLRHYGEVRVFEVGKVFGRAGEKNHLAFGVAAKPGLATKNWSPAAALRGVAEQLLRSLGITDLFFRPWGADTLLLESDHKVVGRITVYHGGQRGAGELDLDAVRIFSSEEFEYYPLPKYPSITRDLSLEFQGDVLVGEVLETINQAKVPHLWDVDVADYYDARRVTLRLVFQATDRTMKDAEADAELAGIVNKLKERFSFMVR